MGVVTCSWRGPKAQHPQYYCHMFWPRAAASPFLSYISSSPRPPLFAPPALPCLPAEAVYTKLQASVNKNPRKLGRSSKHIINTSLVPMEEPKPAPAAPAAAPVAAAAPAAVKQQQQQQQPAAAAAK